METTYGVDMEGRLTKITRLEMDGVNYFIHSVKVKKPKPPPTADEIWSRKRAQNAALQEEEVKALTLMHRDKFRLPEEGGDGEGKYSLRFFVRGGQDALLKFSYPPEYPSDAPPIYSLCAPWMRESERKVLYQRLIDCFSEKSGQGIMYLWVDIIKVALKEENAFLKQLKKEPPSPRNDLQVSIATKYDLPLAVYEGKPIRDRGSCFSPYLAKVASNDDVRKVINQIEHCRKVSSAWRNTYAFRFTTSEGVIVEAGVDGGEPKSGRNLLLRLMNYNAFNVIVYISRRLGGSFLGPDRFRHLNNAADDVLLACGYKNVPEPQKDTSKSKKKNKKLSRKKK